MPKWGLTMEEGVVVAWLAEEGRTISLFLYFFNVRHGAP